MGRLVKCHAPGRQLLEESFKVIGRELDVDGPLLGRSHFLGAFLARLLDGNQPNGPATLSIDFDHGKCWLRVIGHFEPEGRAVELPDLATLSTVSVRPSNRSPSCNSNLQEHERAETKGRPPAL